MAFGEADFLTVCEVSRWLNLASRDVHQWF